VTAGTVLGAQAARPFPGGQKACQTREKLSKRLGLGGVPDKMEIMVFVILVGMFFLDHRLAKIRKIELEMLNTQREIAKALQWMVNNWE
jgi:hypothetical protein